LTGKPITTDLPISNTQAIDELDNFLFAIPKVLQILLASSLTLVSGLRHRYTRQAVA
jgi:hypothetical protein